MSRQQVGLAPISRPLGRDATDARLGGRDAAETRLGGRDAAETRLGGRDAADTRQGGRGTLPHSPSLSHRSHWLSPWRAIDLILAPVALVFFLPLLILAFLALWLDGGGAPIVSERVSGRGKDDDEAILPCHRFRISRPIPAAPEPTDGTSAPVIRISPVGAFLWRTHLDDLPRLFDVIGGRAGLVDPDRPQAFS